MSQEKITLTLTADQLSVVLDSIFETMNRQARSLTHIAESRTRYRSSLGSPIYVQPNGSWWFWTETQCETIGPFDNYALCELAFADYCERLENEPEDCNEAQKTDNSGRATDNQACCGADAQTNCACRRQGETSGR